MTRRLVELYRRLDRWQERGSARIVLGVLAMLLVIGAAWPVHSVARRLAYVEAGIVEILAEANLATRTAEAVQLLESGTVEFEGRAYVDGRYVGATQLFDEAGTLIAAAVMAETFAAQEIPEWCPSFLVATPWTPIGYALLVLGWLLLAIWAGTSVPLLATGLATAALGVPAWLFGFVGATFAIVGIGILGFSFVLLIRLSLAALGGMGQVGAVAATVVREAIRQKGFAAFIVGLLVVLPIVPLWLDPETPLRYQLQTFIGRSLGITFAVASCMTLVLGCATVAFEIRDRQILQLMTKPIARTRYLLGKWLGIMVLDGALLAVCGLSIFIFIQYLQTRPAADAFDAQAVRDEVLVARVGVAPRYDLLPRARLLEMVDAAIEDDPMLRDDIDQGVVDEFDVRRDLFADYQQENLASQRSIAPGADRVYRFEGLGRARDRGANLTLRYKFYAGESDEHEQLPVIFRFEQDGSWTDRKFVPVQTMVLPVPATMIDEEGVLSVAIVNAGFNADAPEGAMPFYPGPYSIAFEPEGIELLYPVSSFEANFLRAMLVTWIKLGFLAMLGVGAASVLSFPVACLTSFAIFLAAEAAPFLAYSIDTYRIWDRDGNVQWVNWLVLQMATGTEWALRSFGQTRPNPALVEGRLVGWSEVFRAVAVIGVGWSAAVLLVSMLVFRRKELAVYSGQG
ncbi:MAG: ABC transporter permease subunit [Planctomycetota bacterium]|jgi:ABC-type transport system involved in multi-copper enzyme maturation permease subunit